MRSSRVPHEGGRLADLDRAGRAPVPLPLRHYREAGRSGAAIQHPDQELEDRRRGRRRRLSLHKLVECEEGRHEAAHRVQRAAEAIRPRRSMTMRRVSRMALLIIGMAVFLELIALDTTRSTSDGYRVVSSAEGVVGRPLTPVS